MSERNNLERMAHVARIATATIAGGALYVATDQIQSSNHSQRVATAQETYKDYLKLAIEHPEMADGDPPPKAAKSYGWFMSNFLYSAEQIFLLFPTDENWKKGLANQNQFCLHKGYLGDPEADYQKNLKSHHHKDFQDFVNAEIKSCPAR